MKLIYDEDKTDMSDVVAYITEEGNLIIHTPGLYDEAIGIEGDGDGEMFLTEWVLPVRATKLFRKGDKLTIEF